MSHDNKENEGKLLLEQGEYKFAKDWHRDFPAMIHVSNTNVCNLECVHCFQPKMKRMPDYHRGFLDFDLWGKICKEVSAWPGVIMNFATDGEPLMHPQFLDMLKLAREFNIRPINVTNNATMMKDKVAKAIIDEFLIDTVNFSIDAYTEETYKKIRGGSFKKIVTNINNFIDLRNEANSPVKIQVNIIDQPEAREELKGFVDHWEKRVDNVMVRTYYDHTSQTGKPGPDITGKENQFDKVERWPCQLLWRRLTINEDGTVSFCVDDWLNKSLIGDLKTHTIEEIWKSNNYNILRDHHIKRNFHENSFCHQCTEWQGMKWDYDYFTAMSKMTGEDYI